LPARADEEHAVAGRITLPLVQYLAVQHKIPLRRFVTPMGYGKSTAVADNSTASGRAQNRRVEVIISKPPATLN